MSALLPPVSNGSESEMTAATEELVTCNGEQTPQLALQEGTDEQHQQHRRAPDDLPAFPPKVFFFIWVAALIAPIVLVLSAATRLSSALGNKGCLPDGTFAIPGTTSIWDLSHFLSVNVPATPATGLWTFTHAKIVDVIWDLLVGRGLQLMFAFVAFNVFSKVLLHIMEDEELPFRTYGAVSFQPGGFSSFFPLIAAMKTPGGKTILKDGRYWYIKPTIGEGRSGKVRGELLVMALLTLYIAALPTLLSAMTSYSSVANPSLFYYPSLEDMIDLGGNHTEVPCNTEGINGQPQGMVPAGGVVQDALRLHHSPDFEVLGYPPDSHFQDYYYTYKSPYDKIGTDPACANTNNTADCPATNISSHFPISDEPLWNLGPPLLNLQVFPPFNTEAMRNASYSASPGNMPRAWVCGNRIFEQKDFSPQPGFNFPNVSGSCNSGSRYRWGFSYHLLLLVCVLNLMAAAAFYALWLYGNDDAEGTRRAREGISTIRPRRIS